MSNIAGGAFIVYVMFIVLMALGWVFNIVAVVHSSFDPITGLVVVRLIGIPIVPLGAILGWFA